MSDLHPLHNGTAKHHETPSEGNIRDLIFGGEDVKRVYLRFQKDDTPIGLPFNPGLYPLNPQRFSRGAVTEDNARDKAANVGKKALMRAPSAPKVK